MSKETLFDPSAILLDRVIFLLGQDILFKIEQLTFEKNGLELGIHLAKLLSAEAQKNKRVKEIMDGGLLLNIKMECITRQAEIKRLQEGS